MYLRLIQILINMPELILLFIILIITSTIFWIFKLPLEIMIYILLFIFWITLINLITKLPLFCAPFVISNKSKIDTITKLVNLLGKNKIIYEPWCWDGRIIRKMALLWVKKAIWYEISIPLIIYAKIINFINYLKWQKSLPTISYWNIWTLDYTKADIIICYIKSKWMEKFEKDIWPKLKKWSYVISNTFEMKWIKIHLEENKVFVYKK